MEKTAHRQTVSPVRERLRSATLVALGARWQRARRRPILLLGRDAINGATTEVDAFALATGGVASVFVRTGDDLELVATSLKKQDGTRAVGTRLDHEHPASGLLRSGQPFVGPVTLFDKPYMTKCVPLKDGAEVIGALFVGIDVSGDVDSLARLMQTNRVLGSGQVYAIDLRWTKSRTGHRLAGRGGDAAGRRCGSVCVDRQAARRAARGRGRAACLVSARDEGALGRPRLLRQTRSGLGPDDRRRGPWRRNEPDVHAHPGAVLDCDPGRARRARAGGHLDRAPAGDAADRAVAGLVAALGRRRPHAGLRDHARR
ncbi:MAG: Cache 3/Cache 2 fusion domain-containing protein [Betaproteobacteria bacterium]